ncbi:hypothetical protein GCM10023171_20890 [Microbacterium panaciterrae]|uniref:Uncharacterized protein n=1 Tax=Microbacterium panaciterrae TaxID=985759 RepID=A0ABP8PFY3_9MICO
MELKSSSPTWHLGALIGSRIGGCEGVGIPVRLFEGSRGMSLVSELCALTTPQFEEKADVENSHEGGHPGWGGVEIPARCIDVWRCRQFYWSKFTWPSASRRARAVDSAIR